LDSKQQVANNFFERKIMHWFKLILLLFMFWATVVNGLSSPQYRGLRAPSKIKVQDAGQAGQVTIETFGGFCLFCAVLTLLCGCCDQDEEKKKQHYRGSALCFVIGVGVIVATVFLMSEEAGTD
jgi:hypothetical protein